MYAYIIYMPNVGSIDLRSQMPPGRSARLVVGGKGNLGAVPARIGDAADVPLWKTEAVLSHLLYMYVWHIMKYIHT